jgi:ATP-binding cassette subfamily B protein
MGTHNQLLLIDSYSSLDIGTVQGTEFQTKLDRAQKWGTGSINNVIYHTQSIIRDITGFITSGFILYFINPYLVLLAILGSISYYFVEKKYGKELYNAYYVSTDEIRIEAEKTRHFRDVKRLVETLLFNTKNLFRAQINKINEEYDDKIIKLKGRESFAMLGADILQILCLFIAIFLVTEQTLSGKLLIGSLLLAFTVYRSFVSVSQSFFRNFSRLEEQSRFAKRWFDIFDMKSKIVSKPDALKPSWQKPPKIEFRNVWFRYPEGEVDVLKDISFVLESGEKMAMVGLNGAGKTTTIKLLCRIYDPTQGSILIDGVDLRDIDLEYWHKNLGVLFQDFVNYQMTVREAIAISKPDEPIDDNKVRLAAEMSGAIDFIQELPKKYEHLLWKGFGDGVELSKGQYQRMAVARIFYRDAFISVLDEPTSAIDSVAEEKIFEILETKMKGKTVILISHRFSTVKNADNIAVIEHGELKEFGSHKALMAKKGRYAELYTMQASRYLDNQ